MDMKSAGLAAVLSFFITGLGQIYNGQFMKGIIFIVIQFINGLLLWVVIGFVTMPIMWLIGIIDAYKSAENHNKRLTRR